MNYLNNHLLPKLKNLGYSKESIYECLSKPSGCIDFLILLSKKIFIPINHNLPKIDLNNLHKGMILHRPFIGRFLHAGVLYSVSDDVYNSTVIHINGDGKTNAEIKCETLNEFMDGHSYDNLYYYDTIEESTAEKALELFKSREVNYEYSLDSHCQTFAYGCINKSEGDRVRDHIKSVLADDLIEVIRGIKGDVSISESFVSYVSITDIDTLKVHFDTFKKCTSEVNFILNIDFIKEIPNIEEHIEKFEQIVSASDDILTTIEQLEKYSKEITEKTNIMEQQPSSKRLSDLVSKIL